MNGNTVTIGECRLSYVHLTEAYAPTPDQKPKFSTMVLIAKANTAAKAQVDAGIEAAKQMGIATKWNGQAPAVVPITLHDGDGLKSNGEPYGPECKGCWVLNCNASADHQPRVIDRSYQKIIDPSQIYSGMYGWVNVTFYPYMFTGKKGIGCGINMVMKTRDGEVLGGNMPTAEEAFAGVPQIDPITGLPMA